MQESQLRKGLLDLAVLGILRHGENYGYELGQALVGAGFDGLGDATVYGAMRRIEQAGWVTSRLVASTDGPARKYYTLSQSGWAQLEEGRQRWAALVSSMHQLLKDPS